MEMPEVTCFFGAHYSSPRACAHHHPKEGTVPLTSTYLPDQRSPFDPTKSKSAVEFLGRFTELCFTCDFRVPDGRLNLDGNKNLLADVIWGIFSAVILYVINVARKGTSKKIAKLEEMRHELRPCENT